MDLDVILLQHEYGIFGGADGAYVLSLAEEVTQPLVVTLHTVLSEPTAHQAEVLSDLCSQAERVVVMTETARRLLVDEWRLHCRQGADRAARRACDSFRARRGVSRGVVVA